MAVRLDNLANIQSIFANGAVTMSASAGADKVIPTRDGFIRDQDITQMFARNWVAGLSNTNLQTIVAATACLSRDPAIQWLIDGSMANEVRAAAIAPDELARIMPATREAFQKAQVDGLIMAIAMKTNWWKIGHHTGVGELVGFAKKSAAVLGIQVSTAEDISALWRLGHWFDTKRVLFALGIPGLQTVNAQGVATPMAAPANWVNPLEVGPEVRKRIASNPAGTAKLSDVLAGIEAVKVIPAVNLVESVNLSSYRSWVGVAQDIAANPASYHTGAKYLTGRDPIAIPQIPEFVYVWIKSVLEATGASATLLDAQCFKSVGVNAGLIKAIKAMTENMTGVRPETISTLAVYVDGAAPAKVAQAAEAKK